MALVRYPFNGVYWNFYTHAEKVALISTLNSIITASPTSRACEEEHAPLYARAVTLQRRLVQLGNPPTLQDVRLPSDLTRQFADGAALPYDSAALLADLQQRWAEYLDGCRELLIFTGLHKLGGEGEEPVIGDGGGEDMGTSPSDDTGETVDDDSSSTTSSTGLTTGAKVVVGLAVLGGVILVLRALR